MTGKQNLLDNLNSTLDLQRSRIQKIKGLLTQDKYRNKEELLQDFQKIEDIFSQAEKLYNSFKNASGGTWETIKEDSQEVFNALMGSLNHLTDKFPKEEYEEIKKEVMENINHSMETTESYIKQNPLTSVLYGFVIGFVFGKLMK